MTGVGFVAITLAAGLVSLVLRNQPRASVTAGLLGLGAGVVAAWLMPSEPDLLGPGSVVAPAYARGVLVLLSVAGLLLVLVSATDEWVPELPGSLLVALAGAGLALTAPDLPTALVAALAAAVAGVVAVAAGGTERSLLVATRELRTVVATGAVALVAIALAGVGAEAPPAVADGPAAAAGFLAVAAGSAIRLGAIPFHLRTTRLAAGASNLVLPIPLVWTPAVFALVAIAWAGSSIADVAPALPLEQSIVVLIAATTIVFGTVAALLHDDVQHVLAYAVVADAGVGLLAFTSFGPEALDGARAWVVVFVVGKTALAAWVAALGATFGKRRIGELGGWARHAPVAGVALVLIAIGAVGWPGSTAFDARMALTGLVQPSAVGSLLLAGSVASLAIYVRLLAIGVRRPTAQVAGSPGLRPISTLIPAGDRPGVAGRLATGWLANRRVVAAGATLGLATLAALVGTGVVGAG